MNDTLTLAITGETTAIPVLVVAGVTKDATTWFHPRAFASQNTDAVAATDAFVCIPVFNERIKVVVTNAATGPAVFTVYYNSED